MLMLMPSPISVRIAGRPAGGRRHLDHQVVAPDRLPEMTRLGDGVLGRERQIGRHFEADIAVDTAGLVIDRSQHIRRRLDVGDREPLEEIHDRGFGMLGDGFERVVVLVRIADRLLEDRRVRGDAAQVVLLDHALELALGNEAAGDEVEPYGLTLVGEQALQRVHARHPFPASWSRELALAS